MITRARAQEKRRRLILFLRIPSETWTDVSKMFPRRTLVQKISPVCYRLKEISNLNVRNIHVITQADQFYEKLKRDDPEAKQQLVHLAGNDCQLDSQFRLIRFNITPENKVILRHCIELFRGCCLSFSRIGNRSATLIAECLTHLEAAKPIAIAIKLYNSQLLKQFLRHPTAWECNRISLFVPPYRGVDLMPIAVHFLDWLHNQPTIGVDDRGDGAEQGEVRCLIIKSNYKMVKEAIDRLINGCIQNLQQSQYPEDRRRFVISFSASNREETTLLDQFECHHNQMTGEFLLLEHAYGPIATVFRLRRSLTEEAANGNEFYRKTFKRDSPWPWDEFVVNDDGTMVNID